MDIPAGGCVWCPYNVLTDERQKWGGGLHKDLTPKTPAITTPPAHPASSHCLSLCTHALSYKRCSRDAHIHRLSLTQTNSKGCKHTHSHTDTKTLQWTPHPINAHVQAVTNPAVSLGCEDCWRLSRRGGEDEWSIPLAAAEEGRRGAGEEKKGWWRGGGNEGVFVRRKGVSVTVS